MLIARRRVWILNLTPLVDEAPGMHYWKECGDFLKQFRRNFHHTGAIMPSSRYLARALVAEIRSARSSARILEVGPGTGSVTREILRHLIPGDHLDLVEINGQFVRLLQEHLTHDHDFSANRDRLTIIHKAVEELPGEGIYDFIVSALPLNNFPVAQVRTIFRAYDRLLKPGGLLTYYEYALLRQLKVPFADRQERRRLLSVGRLVGGYIRDYQVRRQRILINVPPATVRHLKLKPEVVGSSSP